MGPDSRYRAMAAAFAIASASANSCGQSCESRGIARTRDYPLHPHRGVRFYAAQYDGRTWHVCGGNGRLLATCDSEDVAEMIVRVLNNAAEPNSVAAFVAGANWFCAYDNGTDMTHHERAEAERQARRQYDREANDARTDPTPTPADANPSR